jgi:hypothetical protein
VNTDFTMDDGKTTYQVIYFCVGCKRHRIGYQDNKALSIVLGDERILCIERSTLSRLSPGVLVRCVSCDPFAGGKDFDLELLKDVSSDELAIFFRDTLNDVQKILGHGICFSSRGFSELNKPGMVSYGVVFVSSLWEKGEFFEDMEMSDPSVLDLISADIESFFGFDGMREQYEKKECKRRELEEEKVESSKRIVESLISAERLMRKLSLVIPK